MDNYDKDIPDCEEKFFYILLIFYHYFMSFSSLNTTPTDGEKKIAYQHLQDNTLSTPNWIDTEQNSSYENMSTQLTFRHAES